MEGRPILTMKPRLSLAEQLHCVLGGDHRHDLRDDEAGGVPVDQKRRRLGHRPRTASTLSAAPVASVRARRA